jgi:hypothetical protein
MLDSCDEAAKIHSPARRNERVDEFQCGPYRLDARARPPTSIRLTAHVASRLNQPFDTNRSPRWR